MAAMPANAQDSKVTLHVKDMPLGDVVKELRKQTGKDFLFSNREVDANHKVTVDVTAKPLKEVLPLVFGKNYRFEIEENVVIVRPFVQTTASGQKGLVVSGIVLDEKQQPLPGVTVQLVGTPWVRQPPKTVSSRFICRSRRERWSSRSWVSNINRWLSRKVRGILSG